MWCVRVFVSFYISVCKPARKRSKCTQPRWSRCTFLHIYIYRRDKQKKGHHRGSSWIAKYACNFGLQNISAFSCSGTACSLDPDGIPQPNCILDAQLQNLGKFDCEMEHWTSIHWRRIKTSWPHRNHPHAQHLRTKPWVWKLIAKEPRGGWPHSLASLWMDREPLCSTIYCKNVSRKGSLQQSLFAIMIHDARSVCGIHNATTYRFLHRGKNWNQQKRKQSQNIHKGLQLHGFKRIWRDLAMSNQLLPGPTCLLVAVIYSFHLLSTVAHRQTVASSQTRGQAPCDTPVTGGWARPSEVVSHCRAMISTNESRVIVVVIVCHNPMRLFMYGNEQIVALLRKLQSNPTIL